MKNKIIILMVSIFLFTMTVPLHSDAMVQEPSKEELTQTLFIVLYPNIQQALGKYYGDQTRRFEIDRFAKVLKIRSKDPTGGNELYIKLQLLTFQGAHNPPYGLETITFYVSPSQVRLVKFEHQDYVNGRSH